MNRTGYSVLLVVLCLSVQPAYPQTRAAVADWPQWRGPARDGVAMGATLPKAWPKELKPVWRVEVGEGHSSPVIVGERVVLMARQGEEEVTLCLEVRSGRQVWRDAYRAPYKLRADARSHGKGPKATVTVSDAKVYAFGITGILNCLELQTGKVVWRKDFSGEYKKTYPLYGTANSPLIEGDLCILGVGGHNDGAVVAFNKDTGAVVWRVRGEGPSYSSPVAADIAGRRQVIALTQTRLVGLVPKTGEVLWEVPFKTAYDMSAVTPVVHKDMVVYGGYQKPTVAVRVRKEGGGVVTEEVWSAKELRMNMNSPVAGDGHLYGLSQTRGGHLVCVNLDDGKTVWKSPGRLGKYLSMILVDDRILALDTRGNLRVVAASPPGYKELTRLRVSESPTWAHLGLSGSRLYVKDKTHLACFDLANR